MKIIRMVAQLATFFVTFISNSLFQSDVTAYGTIPTPAFGTPLPNSQGLGLPYFFDYPDGNPLPEYRSMRTYLCIPTIDFLCIGNFLDTMQLYIYWLLYSFTSKGRKFH